ncbi:hypothetical protein SS50377_25597 [Spironucleus salmonicida]|uniref:Uncharacterized protein n=1 Tax=Spironucleus salmonicida TaxID=348837 RepID=V6LLA0_9EUKA|nr:hypothetical protein SS50377_25597 [Spironucleus salmonicida]|eukprot:EST45143.1 Hypothetical protein SS50377_15166 [Spironucleus salmonicida]
MSSHQLTFDPLSIHILDRTAALIHFAILSKHTNSLHFFDFNTSQQSLSETRKILLNNPVISSFFNSKQILILQNSSLTIYQLSGQLREVELSFTPHQIFQNYITSKSGQIFIFNSQFDINLIAKLALPPLQVLRLNDQILTISLLQAQRFEIQPNDSLKEILNLRVNCRAATTKNDKIVFASENKIYEFGTEIKEVKIEVGVNVMHLDCFGELSGKCWFRDKEIGSGFGSVVSCCEGVDCQIFGFQSWELGIWW